MPRRTHEEQTRLVFRMEHVEFRGLWRNVRVSLKYRRRLLRRLCRLYGLPQIKLYSRTHPGVSGRYLHNDKTGRTWIETDPKYGRDLMILAHEFAHYLTHETNPGATDHGPAFLRNYMRVLHSLRLVPCAGFRQACRKWGLTIASR